MRFLTFSRRRPISDRNQSIDLPSKSMDWFLCDIGLRHEKVKKTKFYLLNPIFHFQTPSQKILIFFQTKPGKISFDKNFLQREGSTLSVITLINH